MTNTTALDLDRLEALARAATPGPWELEQREVGEDTAPFVFVHKPGPHGAPDDGMRIRIEKHHMPPARKPIIGGRAWENLAECTLANADFIAAANPAAILQLVADLRAALAAKGQQEPVAIHQVRATFGNWKDVSETLYEGAESEFRRIVYAAPDAQQSEAGAPEGFALVPLIPTRAMQRIMDEEGWQWEDLLAAAEAITEEQYNDIQRGTREASSPLEQAAQALGDRAAGHYRNGDYELQDECLRCADVVRDQKNEGDEK